MLKMRPPNARVKKQNSWLLALIENMMLFKMQQCMFKNIQTMRSDIISALFIENSALVSKLCLFLGIECAKTHSGFNTVYLYMHIYNLYIYVYIYIIYIYILIYIYHPIIIPPPVGKGVY